MQSTTTRIWIPLFCLLCISNISCKKFLATYSQNENFIESAADLDEILIGDAYLEFYQAPSPDYMYSMDDDIAAGIPAGSFNTVQETGFHYWQAQPRMSPEGKISNSDNYFGYLYSRIARINTILQNVPLLREKGEPAKTLNRISGEAWFLRAYYYFLLVNLYGKPYKTATAATDFGVPLKTDPAIKEQFAARSSTKQVFDQIVADLLEAEQALAGANESSTTRANQASVQALLCRVYLYMENYEQAIYYANKVINIEKYQLKNLNGHPAGEDFLTKNTPEVIFTMCDSKMAGIMVLRTDIPTQPYYKPSDDLTLTYSPQDLRLKAFFIQNSKGQMKAAKKRKNLDPSADDASDKYLLRLAEIYLNKAEALAALDRFEEARNTLQEFRKTRFKPNELPPIHAEGQTLINTIRDERRLELCFEAHRWFDLRRYGVNSKYPFSKTIQHRSIVFAGAGYVDNGYYELGPYEQDAAAYIIPIANDEIEFNKGQLTNEPRPERPLKQ